MVPPVDEVPAEQLGRRATWRDGALSSDLGRFCCGPLPPPLALFEK